MTGRRTIGEHVRVLLGHKPRRGEGVRVQLQHGEPGRDGRVPAHTLTAVVFVEGVELGAVLADALRYADDGGDVVGVVDLDRLALEQTPGVTIERAPAAPQPAPGIS